MAMTKSFKKLPKAAKRAAFAAMDAGVLVAGPGGGRSTKYGLQSPPPVAAQL